MASLGKSVPIATQV